MHCDILFLFLKTFVSFKIPSVTSVSVTRRVEDAYLLSVNELPQCIASPFAVQQMQCVPADSWGAL